MSREKHCSQPIRNEIFFWNLLIAQKMKLHNSTWRYLNMLNQFSFFVCFSTQLIIALFCIAMHYLQQHLLNSLYICVVLFSQVAQYLLLSHLTGTRLHQPSELNVSMLNKRKRKRGKQCFGNLYFYSWKTRLFSSNRFTCMVHY